MEWSQGLTVFEDEEKAETHREHKNRTAFGLTFNLKLVNNFYVVDMADVNGTTTLLHWLPISRA